MRAVQFVDRMDLAYQIADVVICRAGALTIAELCAVGQPSILVPSPNVAEDHQTPNALAMVEPEQAPNSAQERLVAMANPPGSFPSHLFAALNMSVLMPS